MLSYEGIAKNFRFTVVQVTKQLERTLRLLDSPDPRLVEAVQTGDDYIDTQKSLIENECFKFIGFVKHQDERLIDAVRAISVITSNLERIADLTVNVSRQVGFLGDTALLKRFDYKAYFAALFEGLNLISDAMFDRDSTLALRICYAEEKVDQLYGADVQVILGALRPSGEPNRLVTVLFILHYLERMGDALLNIGEAILFTILGEKLKFRQFRVLEDAVAATPDLEPSLDDKNLASIWGTRSGVRVGTMEEHNGDADNEKILFKEGNPDKLNRERENLQRWAAIAPGVVPKVVEYEQRDAGAALLVQYLDGATFQDILLNAETDVVRCALARLKETLRRVWTTTKRPEPVNGRYLQQLTTRLDDVHRLHPHLAAKELRVGSLHVPSFAQRLDMAADADAELAAPFSVFIHGDFNIDNIIYNRDADTLHFVDVHRSCEMDYVQDASVFLVSIFRRPVFVPRIRVNLEAVSHAFLRFLRSFAAEEGDATFEARLALGLIRSFATSTRFELNRRFAKRMQARAELLLDRLLAHKGRPWDAFRMPDGVLVY